MKRKRGWETEKLGRCEQAWNTPSIVAQGDGRDGVVRGSRIGPESIANRRIRYEASFELAIAWWID